MNATDNLLQKRADRLVQNEVYCHVGGLIQELEEAMAESSQLEGLVYRFREDLTPTEEQIDEYIGDNTTDNYTPDRDEAASELVYDTEILEYWAVSQWLAKKLKDNGEMVAEFGLTHVWGRTTSGQAIAIDYVIEEIVRQTGYAQSMEDEE